MPDPEKTGADKELDEKQPGGTGGGSKPDDTDKDPEKSSEGKDGKYVSLERHKEKVDKLKARVTELETAETERKKGEMSELERVQAENKELKGKLSVFESKDAKLGAVDKALERLGEGYAIPADKQKAFKNTLNKLQFDPETVEDDVFELVSGVAQPGSGKPAPKTVAGKTPVKQDSDDKKPEAYTAKELAEIHKEDPDRYKQIMAKRKAALRPS